MLLFVLNMLMAQREKQYIRKFLLMLAASRCGKNRPHALFAFDGMLLIAGEPYNRYCVARMIELAPRCLVLLQLIPHVA